MSKSPLGEKSMWRRRNLRSHCCNLLQDLNQSVGLKGREQSIQSVGGVKHENFPNTHNLLLAKKEL